MCADSCHSQCADSFHYQCAVSCHSQCADSFHHQCAVSYHCLCADSCRICVLTAFTICVLTDSDDPQSEGGEAAVAAQESGSGVIPGVHDSPRQPDQLRGVHQEAHRVPGAGFRYVTSAPTLPVASLRGHPMIC